MVKMMDLGPTCFRPTFKAKPWGGRALARIAGKALPPDVPIGESWEVADHPHGMSVVANGPFQGQTLRQLMQKHSHRILGRRIANGRFPLLVKLLHAKKRLSVQVHPDDATAKAMRLKDGGKTEAWYVLKTAPTGSMVIGLKHRRDARNLTHLVTSGGLSERLRVLRPTRGDAVFCPAGAVHALGPGLVLLEVQQNSDATFRLYDWGRIGLDGKPRGLHLTQAMQAVGGELLLAKSCKPRMLRGLEFPAQRLMACEHFVMDRWHVTDPALHSPDGRFEILYVAEGSGQVLDERRRKTRITRGSTVLIPACVPAYRIVPSRPLTIVRVTEPGGV